MQNFQFHLPTRVIFGKGRIRELGENLDAEYERILIVTDKDAGSKSGALQETLLQLEGREVSVFTGVEENPSFGVLDEGKRRASDIRAQLVIGIGGGSPMDAAKGIAVLATNDGDMREFMAGASLKEDPLPNVCIPTTSGTGSEVTPYAVFTDPDAKTKGGYAHPKIFPILSVIDPALTYSMPEPILINTGLDVLTHSIEAYLSTETSPMNDLFAVESIRCVLKYLKNAAGGDKKAMDEMAYASMLGGVAIAHSSTILLHIMGYPLTVFHGVAHGRANAALLPAFMKFMREESTVKQKVRFLDEFFEHSGNVDQFVADLGVSTRLTSYGVKEDEIETFVKKVIVKSDVRITPARVTEEVIARIYRSAK